MPAWGQNQGNIPPRNGTAPCRNAYPLSYPVYAPQELPMSNENPGTTLPSDGFSARPNYVKVDVSFGNHDALGGRLMAVAQADTWDARGSQRWPAAGTWEEPGAATAALNMVRLAPTTSAHPGAGIGVGGGPGPTMLFVTPPVFTLQTRPIYATGL